MSEGLFFWEFLVFGGGCCFGVFFGSSKIKGLEGVSILNGNRKYTKWQLLKKVVYQMATFEKSGIPNGNLFGGKYTKWQPKVYQVATVTPFGGSGL